MEHRIAKVNLCSAGGTAGKGSKTCKIALPTTWVEMLDVTKEHREMALRACLKSPGALDGPEFFRPARKKAQEYWMYSEHV